MTRLFAYQQMIQNLHTTDISDIEDHYRSEITLFQVYKD